MKKALWILLLIPGLVSCPPGGTSVHIPDPEGLTARFGHSSVVHNGTLFVFSGTERTDYLDYLFGSLRRDALSSDDGNPWTAGTPAFYCVGSKALTHEGGIYVTGGMYSTAGSADPQFHNVIWKSGDGVSWTYAGALPDSAGRRDHAFVVHGGRFWILGGNLGREDNALPYGPANVVQTNDVYASADGSSYAIVPPDGSGRWSPREGHAAVSFQGKLWVLGGARRITDGSGGGFDFESLGDAWTTTDGSSWHLEPLTGDSNRWEALGRAFHQVVVLNDALYLIGGIGANIKNNVRRVYNDIQRSTDGLAWNKVAEFPGPRYGHTAVVKDGRIYIVAGRNETGVLHDVFVYAP